MNNVVYNVAKEQMLLLELERLTAERDALLTDAERYQYLRSQAGQRKAWDIYGSGCMWNIAVFGDDSNEPFDKAVDAGRSKKGKP